VQLKIFVHERPIRCEALVIWSETNAVLTGVRLGVHFQELAHSERERLIAAAQACPQRVLVLDADRDTTHAIEAKLSAEFEVVAVDDQEAAFELLARDEFAVVIADRSSREMSGLQFLDEAARRFPMQRFRRVITTGNVDTPLAWLQRAGRIDAFLVKPFSPDNVGELARQQAQLFSLTLDRERLWLESERVARKRPATWLAPSSQTIAPVFLGDSPAIRQVLELAELVAPTRASVLLEGPTGSGKGALAKRIHSLSPRRIAPFASQNCAAIVETLAESQLFGHARGAFTGATRDVPGLFQTANGGTIFLDEIGDASPALQVKLLRALEEGVIRPIGADYETNVDVRVIAATHRDLQAAVNAGTFREDLYYRLAQFRIRLPPLSERHEDLPRLIDALLEAVFLELGCKSGLDDEARALLRSQNWPGNIRQLHNELRRLVILSARTQRIDAALVSAELGQGQPERTSTLAEDLANYEAKVIAAALARHGGNIVQCAAELGVDRSTLSRKLHRLRLYPGN